MSAYRRSSIPLAKSLNFMEPEEREGFIERMTWMLHMNNRSLIGIITHTTDEKNRAKQVKKLKKNARLLRDFREYVPQDEWKPLKTL